MLQDEIESNFTRWVAEPMVQPKWTCPHSRVVGMDVPRGMVIVTNPKARPDELNREFTYDAVYDWK